jgi:hypothetical protein
MCMLSHGAVFFFRFCHFEFTHKFTYRRQGLEECQALQRCLCPLLIPAGQYFQLIKKTPFVSVDCAGVGLSYGENFNITVSPGTYALSSSHCTFQLLTV